MKAWMGEEMGGERVWKGSCLSPLGKAPRTVRCDAGSCGE